MQSLQSDLTFELSVRVIHQECMMGKILESSMGFEPMTSVR